MGGTSMAIPNIAGGSVLIQQYFQSDNWIGKTVLDGPTTRALVINSRTHPSQSKAPDIMFGHCVVDLSTILPFNDEFGVQITYQEQSDSSVNLLDESNTKPSVEQNGHVIAKLQVNKALNQKKSSDYYVIYRYNA